MGEPSGVQIRYGKIRYCHDIAQIDDKSLKNVNFIFSIIVEDYDKYRLNL